MKLYKKVYAYMNNSQIDTNDRLFALLAGIGLFGIVTALVSGLIIGENLESLLATVVAFVVFSLLTFIAFKFNKVFVVSIIVAVILVFIFQPLNFFTSGAIHGGAIAWNIFDTIFVALMLRGKPRIILLIGEAISSGVTYYLYWIHPEWVLDRPPETEFQDSMFSFFLVGLFLVAMIVFETSLLRRENEKAKQQKNEIDDLNHAQNRFFSSMSHEIRTPINTIIGLNEMILRENASEEINEDAQSIQSAGKMLLHLINDILDMSKIQSGQMTLTPTTYVTSDMIADVANMIQARANEKNLDFSVDVSPGLPDEMMGDEVRIKQILINILNNAVKYTNEGAVVLTVHSEPTEDRTVSVFFTITDTGMGIRKESIPYLFDAFKRVDEEKNIGIEGTGLGLSIVKQLVELMGGKVTVDSVYSKGTTFTVEIPQMQVGSRTVGEVNLEKKRSINEQINYKPTFTAPGAKILAVDDTATNLMVVEKLLRETGVSVTTVESGEAALEKTLETEYHLILMDHKMPEMDGIECFHRIRSQTGGRCRDARVVALTANAGSDMAALYAREGFDGYLIKPINGALLEQTVRSNLPRDLVTMSDAKKDIEEKSNLWRDDHSTKAMVSITTDSISAIPPDLQKKYDVTVIPVGVKTEDGEFRDYVDINAEGLYRYIEERGREATLKPISVEEFENFFAEQLRVARNVIHISSTNIGEKSSYQPAEEASKTFDNVFVIDSGHLCGAMGMLVVDSARRAQEGTPPESIVREMEEMKGRIRGAFLLKDLDQMARIGLVLKSQANVVHALSLHPVVYVKNGKMHVRHLVFGSRMRAWKKSIRKALRHPERIDTSIAVVPYVGVSVQERDWIEREILSYVSFDKIIFVCASSVVAISCGSGTFGLMYRYNKE